MRWTTLHRAPEACPFALTASAISVRRQIGVIFAASPSFQQPVEILPVGLSGRRCRLLVGFHQ